MHAQPEKSNTVDIERMDKLLHFEVRVFVNFLSLSLMKAPRVLMPRWRCQSSLDSRPFSSRPGIEASAKTRNNPLQRHEHVQQMSYY